MLFSEYREQIVEICIWFMFVPVHLRSRMEPEERSKRVKLTSSDRIAKRKVRIANLLDKKFAIEEERDEATDELKKLGLRMRIHEIERTVSEYQIDILRLQKAEELDEMKRHALFIEILEHEMEIAQSSLKIINLKRQEATISGHNVELNFEEKNVADDISRIAAELAEKKHILMTRELSIEPSRLIAKYVEATNEMKEFVLSHKGANLEADPTLRTLREAVQCYRVSIDAVSNRPGSPSRDISPRQASSGEVLGSTEEVARGVVMSESSSGSPPRALSPRQTQLGGSGTGARQDASETPPEISPTSLPAWLTTGEGSIEIPRSLNASDAFITLPHEFLDGSGNQLSTGGPIVLYKRPACNEQMNFISTVVIKQGKIGSICGQPGTGKSITTYFTLASHSFTHKIVWVACEQLMRKSFDENTLVPVVVMQNGFKANYLVGYKNLTLDIPKLTESAGKTILALDSASLNTERIRPLVAAANNFAQSKPETNRLIYVSSWGTQDDVGRLPLFERRDHAMTFVHGWKLADYKTAIYNDSFAEAVAQYLDFDPAVRRGAAGIRMEKVESKFYFAGHCARYMFAMQTDEVKTEIDSAVSKVSNYRDVFNQLVGTSSDIAVHRILSRIDNHRCGNSGVDFVSHYALWKLSERHGLDSLLALVKTGFGQNDDGFLGCVYELTFFLTINTSIPFKPKDDKWPLRYVEFDPNRFDNTIPTNIWLKSSNPRQSGYDAVVLIPGKDRNRGIVRFVQITRAKRHALKLQAFADLAERVKAVFKNNSAWLNFEVEIFFLIPSHKEKGFTITPVESRTSLSCFGWPSDPDEIRAKVKFIYTQDE